MKIVVDSSVIIDFLRQKDKKETVLFGLIEKGEELMLPMVVYAEIFAGKSVWQSKQAKKDILDLCLGMELVAMSAKQCQLAGKIRSETGLDLIDCLVAATALVKKMALLTLNKKHFICVKGLKLYDL